MQGDGNNFSPDKTITGVEAASVMVRLLKIDTSTILVPDGSPWYYKEVTAAKNNGILDGISEETLTKNITRADTMQIIMNMLSSEELEPMTDEEITETLSSFSDYEQIPDERKAAAAICVSQKFIVGSDGLISPNDTLTRAQFAQILSNML